MTITLTINAENGADLVEQMKAIIFREPTTLCFDNSDSKYVPPASEPTVVPAGMNPISGSVTFVGGAEPKKRGRKAAIKETANQADLEANPPAVQENAPAAPAVQKAVSKAVGEFDLPADTTITQELCTKIALKVSATKGMQTARDIIKQYAGRVSEIPADKYEEFFGKMKAVLET